jgi:hypothetical protein
MNRRSFLISAITLGAASVISGRFYLKSDTILEYWIEHIVQDHLASGDMEGMDINVFAHDYLINNPRLGSLELLKIYALLPHSLGNRLAMLKNKENSIQEIKRDIITRYLLGSDMFQLDNSANRIVKYLDYPQNICVNANPFARFLY